MSHFAPVPSRPEPGAWLVLVDRGGTFTDVVAVAPDGRRHVRKVLSEDAAHPGEAVRRVLDELAGPGARVAAVKMGTTVATNALLERKGEPVCLAITRGFGDALLVGTQQRPDLFALTVRKSPPLFARVVEVDERVLPDGEVERAPDPARVLEDLAAARAAGCRALAVALVHGFAHPAHERLVAALGRRAGFPHVSVSHDVAPELGLVGRGDTTVVDAALTPLLVRHVMRLRAALGAEEEGGPALRFMTSLGGLVPAGAFRGRDAILSGPAGGVVALARLGEEQGAEACIGFDMGGTSTDVSRWSRAEGTDRVTERRVGGVLLRTPMVDVVTVAAGGGSILGSDGRRFTVGPESAGASPGPACYRAGGPATVTDANVVLGRVQPRWFPAVFGAGGDEPIDPAASRARLAALAAPFRLSAEDAAAGFVRIANEGMAAAIREVSVARGHDVRRHALACFGGAGPQHACALARLLGMRTVLVHPLAGVLSAWGMGLADSVRQASRPVLAALSDEALASLAPRRDELSRALAAEVIAEGLPAGRVAATASLDVRYRGVEESLAVPWPAGADAAALRRDFEARHQRLFGFVKPEQALELVTLRVEAVGRQERAPELRPAAAAGEPAVAESVAVAFDQVDADGTRRLAPRETPVLRRSGLAPGHRVEGPALVVDDTATVVVEPGWVATVAETGVLRLEETAAAPPERAPTERDPVRLEIFANAFMSVAEQMGQTLRRVAHSTNMKERLDFSCAVFTAKGELVANAPHVPVHLGAMGETVRALVAARGRERLAPGLVLCSNDPHRGGSHLPDVTVVTPVFHEGRIAFFVANRGHHADVGGVRPGSMPPASRTIAEEGVVLHDVALVEGGRFREAEVRALLTAPPWPVRDVAERLSDLRSQVAANAVGVRLLQGLVAEHGLEVVRAYLRHVLDDAAEATRDVLSALPAGARRFEDRLDDGAVIAVTVTIGGGRARFDFTGTSGQHPGNLNAPAAVTRAAVLYVLRCLVARPIPLNDGCLEPVEIVLPPSSLLRPGPGAAVAGGNVETSQRVVDVLLGALGAAAASQGTMNNLTFGDATFGHYETLGGGTGATAAGPGADAVHSHMTNTRITDVEVLERRHPVLVRELSILRGTGGAGRHRGGDGLRRVIEARRALSASLLAQRRLTRPFGLEGGGPGAQGRDAVRRADGRVEPWPASGEVEMSPGDALIVETPGGGGWGPKKGSDPFSVRKGV